MIVYRDVIPVVGESVPEGCRCCDTRDADKWWIPETAEVWDQRAVDLSQDGLIWRVACPAPLPEPWLNTLSLD